MSALLERHWDKWVAAPNGCFIWCASYKDSGYPQVYTKERPRVFTQMICEETHGARASFLLLDASRTCCNRQCVRPEHIIWETRAENEKRKTAEAKAAGAYAALAVMRDAGSSSERAQKTWATRSRNTPPFCMHKGPLPPLPPGYVPPMPYADVCPACKKQHTRNIFGFRDGPIGGNHDRRWGHFCEECEKTPFWVLW